MILLSGSFLLALHPFAGGPEFSGIVAHQQQGIDVVRGVFPAVLVQDPGLFGQAHGSQSVILGNGDVPGFHPVHQGIVHTVGALVKGQCFGTFAGKTVGGIAQQQAGNMKLGA